MPTIHEELNPYLVLGVERDVASEDVHQVWKRLILLSHPDRNPGFLEEATARAKELNWAYEILCDVQKRAQWDDDDARCGVRDDDGGDERAGTAPGAAHASAPLEHVVHCGHCLAPVRAAASHGEPVGVRCLQPQCDAEFEALVAAECIRHPRPRLLGEDAAGRSWMAYELHYRGPGHPVVRFQGPAGLRVDRGERFSLTWAGSGSGQPAWWANVDHDSDSTLFHVRPSRTFGLGRRVAVGTILLLLIWVGLSSLGVSVVTGLELAAVLAAVLVSPVAPALVRAALRRQARSSWPPMEHVRRATAPIPGAGRMLMAVVGGAVLAWAVAGSAWGSGVGDWSVFVLWGLAGSALLGGSVHALPRRAGARPHRATVPAETLARRLAVGLVVAAVGSLVVGIAAGGLGRAMCFGAGCLVAAAAVVAVTARHGHCVSDFRWIARATAIALLGWLWIASGLVESGRDAPTPAPEPQVTSDPPPRGLAGVWEGIARGRGELNDDFLVIELRGLRSGRYSGQMSLGGCNGLMRQVRGGGDRRAFSVRTTTMACPSIRAATVQLADGRLRASVRTEDGTLAAVLERTPEPGS